MPRLKMLRGPEPGTEIPLEDAEIRIGRGRKNQIVIQDNEVSRSHCRLIRVLDDYEIHDLGSTNGTFVNGQKVGAGGWLLGQRSIIELGDSITFEYMPSDILGTSIPSGELDTSTYYLVVKQESEEQPEIYLLDRVVVAVGRDVDNDIVVQEPEVSRHHLKLILARDGYALEDLNTLNGTYVNEEQIDGQHRLRNRDMIRVGTRLKLWFTNDPDKLVQKIRSGDKIAPTTHNDATKQSGTNAPKNPDKKRPTEETPAPDNPQPAEHIDAGHGLEMHQLEETVFLAYARDEWQAVVGELFDYLHQNGVSIWSDQYLQPSTIDWVEAIEQAQAESHCLLAVISEKSLRTPYVQRSLRHFLAREKPILLLQYGEIKRTPMMLQSVNAILYDADDPKRTFRTLLAELHRINRPT